MAIRVKEQILYRNLTGYACIINSKQRAISRCDWALIPSLHCEMIKGRLNSQTRWEIAIKHDTEIKSLTHIAGNPILVSPHYIIYQPIYLFYKKS